MLKLGSFISALSKQLPEIAIPRTSNIIKKIGGEKYNTLVKLTPQIYNDNMLEQLKKDSRLVMTIDKFPKSDFPEKNTSGLTGTLPSDKIQKISLMYGNNHYQSCQFYESGYPQLYSENNGNFLCELIDGPDGKVKHIKLFKNEAKFYDNQNLEYLSIDTQKYIVQATYTDNIIPNISKLIITVNFS